MTVGSPSPYNTMHDGLVPDLDTGVRNNVEEMLPAD